MDKTSFLVLRDEADKAICEKRLGVAIKAVEGLCRYVEDAETTEIVGQVDNNYRIMLHYMSKGVADEQRSNYRMRFLQQIDGCFSKVCRLSEICLSESHYALTLNTLNNLKVGFDKVGEDISCRTLFELIWTSDVWSQDAQERIKRLMEAPEFDENSKCLILSATMLAALTFFDVRKVLLLASCVKSNNVKLRARALIGFVLVMAKHRSRCELYPAVGDSIRELENLEGFSDNLLDLQTQIFLTLDTPKFEQRVRNEILPSIIKESQKFKQRKSGSDSLSDILDDMGGKTEWGEVGGDIDEKVKMLMELQHKGADVFIGQFKMVKQGFPFFNIAANWFFPFTQEHPDFPKSVYHAPLVSMIEQNENLCESDKYSFCLVIGQMMGAGNSDLKAANAQLEEMIGGQTDVLPKSSNTMQAAMRSYMLDIYRYFKFYRLRDEAADPFKCDLFIAEWDMWHAVFSENENLHVLADFAFEIGNYSWASILFGLCKGNVTTYRKLGRCYQKMHQYSLAMDFYVKSDVLSPNHFWTQVQLGNCAKCLGDYGEALIYYEQAETLQPENEKLLLRIAECLMQQDEHEAALKKLFKAYYFAPGDQDILRMLAWCSFLCHKYEDSEKYYLKLLENSSREKDLLHAGHEAWAAGNIVLAIERYRCYFRKFAPADVNVFDVFKRDSDILGKHNINDMDIDLMCDVLAMDFE